MIASLDPISEAAAAAARAALPEHVSVGAATMLPRGADPFVASDRPLLLAATRWAMVSPGGVLIGGSPAGMAAVFGFDVPDRPTPVAPGEAKPSSPAPKWADLVIEEARAPLTTFSHAVAGAVAELAGLPPECAASQISMNDTEAGARSESGPIPDGVVVLLHSEEHDVRMVVVVPAIFVARIGRLPAEAEVTRGAGDALARPPASGSGSSPAGRRLGALDRNLADVPIDLSIDMGRARVPLSQVVDLRDGEVLELQQGVDAPVDLVSGDTTVARGDLEVSDRGTLVLVVTSIPGRVTGASPRVVESGVPAVDDGAQADVDSAADAPTDAAEPSPDPELAEPEASEAGSVSPDVAADDQAPDEASADGASDG